MSLLENIRFLCNRTGVKVPALEKELGFGKGSIYKWDKNSPSVDKIQKVAEYFDVTTDFLIFGYDKEIESIIKDLSVITTDGKLRFPDDVLVLIKVRFEPLKREYYDVPLDLDAMELIGLVEHYSVTTEFKKDLLRALEDVKKSYEEGVEETDTIAAHHIGEDWTEEEMETIQKFMEFVKSQRKE